MMQKKTLYPDYIHSTYKPITGALEQRIITSLMRLLVSRGRLYLDFADKTVLIDRGEHPLFANQEIGIAPPPLFALLRMLMNQELHFPQAYVTGKWYPTRGSIADMVIFFRSQKKTPVHGWRRLTTHIHSWFFFRKQYITSRHSTREARFNYNLPTEFYTHFLGKYMVYSCAFFNNNSKTLNAAQLNKMTITSERLQINKGNTVLDIGCGWGELATYIARKYRARVTGISIANNQITYAQDKVKNTSVSKLLSFELADYDTFAPEHHGHFDRIISVGMAEHVGKQRYANFFAAIASMLKPGGLALIHSIVAHQPGKPNQWIDKYIFPGGYIPQISEFLQGAEKTMSLVLEKVYIYDGVHYATTLQHWADLLVKNNSSIMRVLTDVVCKHATKDASESTIELLTLQQFRKWLFYLNAAQSAFLSPEQKSKSVGQFVFKKLPS